MLQRFLRRQSLNWFNKLRQAMQCPSETAEKRPLPKDEARTEEGSKKQKTEGKLDRKRKCAIIFGYNGKGYYGLQRNPGYLSIEEDLCKALLNAGLIPLEHFEYMQKMSFQRAARTDKGVSAAGNVVSLKMLVNKENLVDEINSHLPSQIRVFDCFRTTQQFNSKNLCDARTYSYILPTYSFIHKDEPLNLSYRMDPDLLEKANHVLEMYKGTHNFHNYTSGMSAKEGRAKRYIMEFECRTPYIQHGVEFCEISVKGQSFVMHHIRKMVGTVIAVLKGYIEKDFIEETFKYDKISLPKAPSLGLVLHKLHYSQYNRRFGETHTTIDFEKIKDKMDKFKEEFILSDIYKKEVEEFSMLQWLPELELFTFQVESDPATEGAFLEERVKLKEERLLMTNRTLYGEDYVPPEPHEEIGAATNQQTPSDNLTNEIEATEDMSSETEVMKSETKDLDSPKEKLSNESQSHEKLTDDTVVDTNKDSVSENINEKDDDANVAVAEMIESSAR